MKGNALSDFMVPGNLPFMLLGLLLIALVLLL
jgi:hypothetical protein